MLGQLTRLHGHEAYDYAEAYGYLLNKYEDPYEPARTGLSLEDAAEVLVEDPGLIWLDVVTQRNA